MSMLSMTSVRGAARRGSPVRWCAVAILTCLAAVLLTVQGAGRAGATPQMLCGLHQVSVPESSTGVTTGTYLTPGRSLQVTGSGSIWAGYWFTGTNGPEGWDRLGGAGYPQPNARAFSLLARVNGSWTEIGRGGTVTNTGSTTEELQFRTNDNVPGNGSGAFVATYTTCDVSTAPASQYSLRFVQARHSALCLTVAGESTADGANVQQDYCNQGQQWTLRPNGDYYEIVARGSGKCLDVAGFGVADAVNVQLWTCLGGTNQQWSLVQTSPRWYQVNSRNSGKCLDVEAISLAPGANIFQWTCWGGANQQWSFTSQIP